MTLHGVDIFIWTDQMPELPEQNGALTLKLIANRGTRVWPQPAAEFERSDWFRCRFLSDEVVSDAQIDSLLQDVTAKGYVWTKCQKLFRLDGVDQFSQPY